MSPLVAAVVLLWVVVILLAFAMAGLLQQVRELKLNPPAAAASGAGGAGSAGGAGEVAGAVAAVAPGPDRRLAAVLLVEEGCGVCQNVLPRFVAAMEKAADEFDFVVLTDGDGATIPPGPRVVADPAVHSALDPGWFPAMLTVSSDEVITSVQPAGSPEAIDALVAAAREQAVVTR